MATGGEALQDEDDAENVCETCLLDGNAVEAVYFCPSCEDYMCSACSRHHSRLKATRFHDVFAFDKINENEYTAFICKAPEPRDQKPAAENEVTVALPRNAAPTVNKSTQTENMFISQTDDEGAIKHYRIFSDKLAKLYNKIDVSHSSDEDDPFITGITCMENGEMCIIDKCNMTIKWLDNELQVKKVLKCKYQPYDIAEVDETEAVITIPFKKELHFIEFKGHLEFGRKINLPHCCYGVTTSKSHLYVVCDSNFGSGGKREIFQLTLAGHVERTIDIQEITKEVTQLHHIAINPRGDKLYLTGIQFIVCMTMDGREVYKMSETELEDSEIVIDEPRGITIDDEDNALVCCDYEKKVLLVQPDGIIQREVLTNVSIHGSPHSIAYREADNMLLIGCENKGELLKYHLK